MTEVADQENDPQIGNTTEEDDEDITEKKETLAKRRSEKRER